MTDWPGLDRFLRTDPRDVGCDEAMRVLHIYVELMSAGQDPAVRFPGRRSSPACVRTVWDRLRRPARRDI